MAKSALFGGFWWGRGEGKSLEYNAAELVQAEVKIKGREHTKAAFKLSELELRLALKGEIRVLTERRILCVQAHRLLHQTGHTIHQSYWYKY